MIFLGLSSYRWILILCILVLSFLLLDALAGHYRTGFKRRSQYLPFAFGLPLVFVCALLAIFPMTSWLQAVVKGFSIAVALVGLVGVLAHQYFGMARKPGGYSWWLHYLMYGPPPLAPLGLSSAGFLAYVGTIGIQGAIDLWTIDLRTWVLILVAIVLFGVILQSAVYHYRGAFNNPAMYAPLSVPLVNFALLAILVTMRLAGASGQTALIKVAGGCMWLTMLTGFIGLGMHLRGFDRQMGGLHVTLFNLLEGPPAWAPGLFAWSAATGLVGIYLM